MASGLLEEIGSALRMRSDDCAVRQRASGMIGLNRTATGRRHDARDRGPEAAPRGRGPAGRGLAEDGVEGLRRRGMSPRMCADAFRKPLSNSATGPTTLRVPKTSSVLVMATLIIETRLPMQSRASAPRRR